MHRTSLTAFVHRISQGRQLRYADLCRLKRDVLPAGLQSRTDAERLLAMDRVLDRADRAWAQALGLFLADLVLTREGAAHLHLDDAQWLGSQLALCRPSTAAAVRKVVLQRATTIEPGVHALLKPGSAALGRKQRMDASSPACEQDGLCLVWPAPQPSHL